MTEVQPGTPLTAREIEVLYAVAELGASAEAIGLRLYVTTSTVKTYLRRAAIRLQTQKVRPGHDTHGSTAAWTLAEAIRRGYIVLEPLGQGRVVQGRTGLASMSGQARWEKKQRINKLAVEGQRR